MKKIYFLLFFLIMLLFFSQSINACTACVVTNLEDGSYTGYSTINEHGYIKAEINMEWNDIYPELLKVKLIGYNIWGNIIDEEYVWEPSFNALQILPNKFEKANGTNVDVISGATATYQKSKMAVRMALEKARGVENFNGTYFGDSTINNITSIAWVNIENEKINQIKLYEYSNSTKEMPQWEKSQDSKNFLAGSFLEEKASEIDLYFGSELISDHWIFAVENALNKTGLK